MADNQIRKKLSLGRKKLSTTRSLNISANLKTKLKAKKEDSIKNFFENASKELNDLYEERQILKKRIIQIEQRLLFAKSDPLQDFLFELKSKDFDLLVKINTYIQII